MHSEEALAVLPEVVKTLGILRTFEACLDLCATNKSPEEAVAFAHEVFLVTAEGWFNER